jgi:hypothetical protein
MNSFGEDWIPYGNDCDALLRVDAGGGFWRSCSSLMHAMVYYYIDLMISIYKIVIYFINYTPI